MAFKQFLIDEHLTVSIYKRRGTRHMRLSVRSDNTVRVTIPFWVTYQVGLKFAKSKKEWITDQIKPKEQLKSGQLIGKYHQLEFIAEGQKIRTRLVGTTVKIYHPSTVTADSEDVQKAAETACIRALKSEATKHLPPRLAEMAKQHGFKYKDVSIKKMKSRWGSCDTNKNIVLNLYLMQLPWELVDYVLLHELTHTNLMQHGPEFWAAMEEVMPNIKSHRLAIKGHKPHLEPA